MTSSLLSSPEQQRLQLLPNARGRIPHLLAYFLEVVSYTHVTRKSAKNLTVSEVFGIAEALGSRQARPSVRKCNNA